MKTYIYYSEANKEILAVMAKDTHEAAKKVMNVVSNHIITDDYILRCVLEEIIAPIGLFNIK